MCCRFIPMQDISLHVDESWTEPAVFTCVNIPDHYAFLKTDSDGHPLALGEGVNKIREIVKASEKIGMDWLIVENDNPVPDGLKDAERSIKYLKKLL